MRKTAAYWIDKLNLTPHPEGGHFKEVYKSDETIQASALPKRYDGDRSFITSIYYLLESGQKSKLHQLKSDETWVFIDGSPVNIQLFKPNNEYEKIVLGREIHEAQTPQYTIPRFTHFGAEPVEVDSFSLAACIVAPGFDFNDFSFSDKEDLLEKFPRLSDIIEKFT